MKPLATHAAPVTPSRLGGGKKEISKSFFHETLHVFSSVPSGPSINLYLLLSTNKSQRKCQDKTVWQIRRRDGRNALNLSHRFIYDILNTIHRRFAEFLFRIIYSGEYSLLYNCKNCLRTPAWPGQNYSIQIIKTSSVTISKLANLRICMPFYWKIGIRHAKISRISKKIRNRQEDKYKNILIFEDARRQFLQAEKTQIWAKPLHFNINFELNQNFLYK